MCLSVCLYLCIFYILQSRSNFSTLFGFVYIFKVNISLSLSNITFRWIWVCVCLCWCLCVCSKTNQHPLNIDTDTPNSPPCISSFLPHPLSLSLSLSLSGYIKYFDIILRTYRTQERIQLKHTHTHKAIQVFGSSPVPNTRTRHMTQTHYKGGIKYVPETFSNYIHNVLIIIIIIFNS